MNNENKVRVAPAPVSILITETNEIAETPNEQNNEIQEQNQKSSESEKKDNDDSVSAVSQSYQAESDNLPFQDKKTIVPTPLSRVELIRVIRALPGLTPIQIRILEIRYVNLVHEYEVRAANIDIIFHFSRAFISLGSVAVPALLSIQSPTSSNPLGLYWVTWTISLLVTILHNFSTLFRYDKKYFGIHNTLERLKSEGWQYLELSGRYSGHYGHRSPTHENQFTYFVHIIEKIRLRQIGDEYNTVHEAEKTPNQAPNSVKPLPIGDQILPSPLDLTLNRGLKKENIMTK